MTCHHSKTPGVLQTRRQVAFAKCQVVARVSFERAVQRGARGAIGSSWRCTMHRPHPLVAMYARRLIPFASVVLLVAVMRPGGGVAIGVSLVALAATFPWSALRARGGSREQRDGADAAFAQGWEHLQREEFIDAEREFRGVLAERPSDADARLYLGLALAGQGRHADAIEPLRAAAVARPLDAEAQAGLGISLAEAGEIFLAVTALREALRLRPTLRLAQQALERLLPAATALEEERTAPAHARFHRSAGRRPALRNTRKTTPGSSLELQAGA